MTGTDIFSGSDEGIAEEHTWGVPWQPRVGRYDPNMVVVVGGRGEDLVCDELKNLVRSRRFCSMATGIVSVADLVPGNWQPEYRYLNAESAYRHPLSYLPDVGIYYADGLAEGVVTSTESTLIDDCFAVAAGSTAMDSSVLLMEEAASGLLREIFRDGANETFFDGIDNAFQDRVRMAIEIWGDIAVRALQRIIRPGSGHLEVAEEALRVLGNMQDTRTHHSRLAVLIGELGSAHPRIRDAASVGLVSLGDPVAVESLSAAVSREESTQLRRNLESALSALRAPVCLGS